MFASLGLLLLLSDPAVDANTANPPLPVTPAGRVLRLNKKVLAKEKLVRMPNPHAYVPFAFAMREPGAEYADIADDVNEALLANLRKTDYPIRLTVLERFAEDAEGEVVRAEVKARPYLRHVLIATLQPSETGDTPEIWMEMYAPNGTLETSWSISGALFWRAVGEAQSAAEKQELFERRAWRIKYLARFGWAMGPNGGMMQTVSSYPIVVPGDDPDMMVSEEDMLEGTPDLASKQKWTDRTENIQAAVGWGGCATLLGIPVGLACTGGCLGLLFGGVYALVVRDPGSAVIGSVGTALVLGVVGLVVSVALTLPWMFANEAARFVAYYVRKDFYFSAVNAHNTAVADRLKVNLEQQATSYRPTSLLCD